MFVIGIVLLCTMATLALAAEKVVTADDGTCFVLNYLPANRVGISTCAESYCTDSDNGANFTFKGEVKSNRYPNGTSDSCFNLSGTVYLFERICKGQNYSALQKNCADVGRGFVCLNGACTQPSCTPQCSGKQCGADGCGRSCGTCGEGGVCTDSGSCNVFKDSDKDSISDGDDNCPNNFNQDQKDADLDGEGDVCDSSPYGTNANQDGTCVTGWVNINTVWSDGCEACASGYELNQGRCDLVVPSPINCGVRGDLNQDKKLDGDDVTLLLYVLKSQSEFTCGGVSQKVCDYSSDGYYVCKNGVVYITDELGVAHAQESCKDTSCTPLGDLNQDKTLDGDDVTLLLYVLKSQSESTCGGANQNVCDYSSDGYYVCKNGVVYTMASEFDTTHAQEVCS